MGIGLAVQIWEAAVARPVPTSAADSISYSDRKASKEASKEVSTQHPAVLGELPPEELECDKIYQRHDQLDGEVEEAGRTALMGAGAAEVGAPVDSSGR